MVYSGRSRIAPLYVRTVTLEPPLPRVSRNEFGADAAGRTRVNPFWIAPVMVDSMNAPDTLSGDIMSTLPL
jgi:hypothetical protein